VPGKVSTKLVAPRGVTKEVANVRSPMQVLALMGHAVLTVRAYAGVPASHHNLVVRYDAWLETALQRPSRILWLEK
jgi:hypothetical protein